MASAYRVGSEWRLYLDTAADWDAPTWVPIRAFQDPSIDFGQELIEVQPQNEDAGALVGKRNPVIKMKLFDDTGDANVVSLIAAATTGGEAHIALAYGDIETDEVKYYQLEVVMTASMDMPRGGVTMYDIEARRTVNSDHNLEYSTVSA